MIGNLLIVEDEKLIRQGIKTIIQRSGVPVETILECNNGLTALEILKTEKIDVMFTDIRMPKMTGIELVQHVQALPHKPLIVAVSGYDDFNYAVQLLREGVREYILKPIEREQIKKVLEKLSEEIASRQEQEEDQKRIGWQQIKYLILNNRITDEEKQLILKKYGPEYLEKPYRVGCSIKGQIPSSGFKGSIVLKEVEGHTVYIMTCEEDEAYFEQKGRYSGISKVYRGLEGLTKAYEEALEARKQAFYTNAQYVDRSCTLSVSESSKQEKQAINQQTMLQLVQMVGTYKVGEALRMLKEMAHAVSQHTIGYHDFEGNIKVLTEEITNTYQNVLQIESVDIDRLTTIFDYACLDDYMEVLIPWMIEINERITNKFDDYKNKQKVQEAILYIRQNYHTDLNMAVVSNYISMNYSLFSYVFKQYTGKNFVAYLKELRMTEARKLLETTPFKVNEISHKVGYENEKHFMKTFKTVCGVSPTEYRKNMLFKDAR